MRHDNRSESLYRLTYCSRNTIETHISDADIEGELRGILATARRCNKENDITGALLFTASGFAQVLEGPRDVVERTFERISTDPRHADVLVLDFSPSDRRGFPDWSMGFRRLARPGPDDPLAALLADAGFAGPNANAGSDVLRLLEDLVQQEDSSVFA
jgi:hypothetical protein